MQRMKSPRVTSVALIGTIAICATGPAQADGIDIVPYLTRVGGARSLWGIVASVLGLMVINYLLNLLVIGWPAVRVGHVEIGRVMRGLVRLTLLGQAADRVGALLAVPLAGGLGPVLHLGGDWVAQLLVMNFIVSGFAIGALVLYLLRRRWQLSRGVSWTIAIMAGVLTNPAWAIGLWFLP